jgi:hypothetical protein
MTLLQTFYVVIIDRYTKETLFDMTVIGGNESDARDEVRNEYKNRIKYSKKSTKLPLVAGAWTTESVEI